MFGLSDAMGATSFHLVGHDLGGILAWELACRHPARIRSLSIASTPHLAAFAKALAEGGERLPPFDLFRRADVPEQLLLGDDAQLLRAAYAGLDLDAIEHYAQVFSAPGVLTATLSYFRAFDFAAWRMLPAADVPTLFVWGADDPFLAPSTALATREHVVGPYKEAPLEGVGHWVPELAADQVTALPLDQLTIS